MYREAIDERTPTLRPRRQFASGKSEARYWNNTMRLVMRIATATGRQRRTGTLSAQKRHAKAGSRTKQQRVAVRITYSNSKTPGLWRAHGVYLQRESAAGEHHAGFSDTENSLNLARQLDSWQTARDPRLFKIILSPEFGERMNLENYTRETMARIQSELGQSLEWMAITHHNTEHPHAHVVLRSIDRNGHEVRLPKELVRETARALAQDVATEHLGFRTEFDLQQTRTREIEQNRITSLDREIERHRDLENGGAEFGIIVDRSTAQAREQERLFALQRRLAHLEEIGLARRVTSQEWSVDAQFIAKLRVIQHTADRQKSMTRHMALASAPNLPVVFDNWRDLTTLRGRILGHGEEEGTDRHYFLLETTDGKVHYLSHRRETEEKRHQGELAPNTFVSLRKDKSMVHIFQYGDAEELLHSERFLAREPSVGQPQGDLPGWLGRYAQAVSHYQDLQSKEHTLSEEDVSMQLRMPEAVKKLLGFPENGAIGESNSPQNLRDTLLQEAQATQKQWIRELDEDSGGAPDEIVDQHFEQKLFEINHSLKTLSKLDPSITEQIDVNQMGRDVWRELREIEDRREIEPEEPGFASLERNETEIDDDALADQYADYDPALDYDPIADLEERDPDDDLDYEDELDDEELIKQIEESEQAGGIALVGSQQVLAYERESTATDLEEQYRRTVEDLAFGPRNSVSEALQDTNKAQELSEERAAPTQMLGPDTALTVDLVHSEEEYEANSLAEIDTRDPLDAQSLRAQEHQAAYERAVQYSASERPAFEPNTEHGGYVGEFVAETDHFLVQLDGNRWIMHEKENLSHTPDIGSRAIVQYDSALEKAKVVEIPEHFLEHEGLEV